MQNSGVNVTGGSSTETPEKMASGERQSRTTESGSHRQSSEQRQGLATVKAACALEIVTL